MKNFHVIQTSNTNRKSLLREPNEGTFILKKNLNASLFHGLIPRMVMQVHQRNTARKSKCQASVAVAWYID